MIIVDDNPDACATAAKLLWAAGYQADVAYDGRTAIQLADQRPYTLAIIDYQLPDGNGCDLFSRLKQRQRCPRSLPGSRPSTRISDPSLPHPSTAPGAVLT